MEPQTIYFRRYLIETMGALLATVAPGHAMLSEFASELVVAISRYREEGNALFPAVFICEDLGCLTQKLGGRDPIRIGWGVAERDTIRQALKQCSPLTERGQWAIFMVIDPDGVTYGVFRTESAPLSPTAFSRLRALEDRSGFFILGVTQVGDGIVEVRGGNGQALQLYLSGARIDTKLPMAANQAFLNAISREAEDLLKQSLRDFYYRIFTDLRRVSHGTLLAVLDAGREKMDVFDDGVILPEPLNIGEAVSAYIKNPRAEESARLQSQAALIRGMLNCDGITLLRTDGAVVGYNVFVQNLVMSRATSVGGARRRAFDALAKHLGKGVRLAVYRSQDGVLDYVEAL
jgi:hypothetical protein